MSQIRQFIDPKTNEDVYPVTLTDALYTSSGLKLSDTLPLFEFDEETGTLNIIVGEQNV